MASERKKATRLTDRPEYLAVAATGRKWVTPAFIVQAKPGDGPAPARTGYTATKKVGNAVIRSKARRRLKEAVRLVLPEHGQPGWDYVLVCRTPAAHYPFDKLQADLRWALAKLASGADVGSSRRPDRPKQKT